MRTYSDEPGFVWDDNDEGRTMPTRYRQWCLVCGQEIDLALSNDFDTHLQELHGMYYDFDRTEYILKQRVVR